MSKPMIKNKEGLVDYIVNGTGDELGLHKEFHESMRSHQMDIKDLGKNIDLFNRELKGPEAEELKDLGKELKKAKAELYKAKDSFDVKHAEKEVERVSERLLDKAKDYGFDFREQLAANETALKTFSEEHGSILEHVTEKVNDQREALSDKINIAKDKNLVEVEWKGANVSLADAEKELDGMKNRLKSAKDELKYFKKEMEAHHNKIDEKLKRVASDVESKIGFNLIEDTGKLEKDVGSQIVHAAENVGKSAKGASTGMKVAGVGLGALIGYAITKATGIGGEDSSIAPLVGAGAGGVVGHLAANKLFAKAANVASHVRA